MSCPHSPSRYFCGHAGPMTEDYMWIACCDCGEVLFYGAALIEAERRGEQQQAERRARDSDFGTERSE